MLVEIWSDVVCPWCYIGKRRLESALRDFPGADEVQIRWRSYELNPSAPKVATESADEMLARKYGASPEQVAAMQERVTNVAAAEGLAYRLDLAWPVNSFDAHRLIQLAGATGHQDEMEEALFSAYFTRGAAVGDHEVLTDLAVEAGLPREAVQEVLTSDAYADAVRADEAEAAELGVTGVPFFVFDRKLAVGGAQDVEVFTRALTEAQAAPAA